MTGLSDQAPLISIVMPAYNASETLQEALDCVTAQTERDWECIVVDDGSVDHTLLIARAAARLDPRIQVLSQANAGVSAARNVAMAAAHGTWVLLFDADDWLEPDALAHLIGPVRADPTVDATYGRWARASHAGGALDHGEFRSEPDELFGILASHCVLVVHSCLFRRGLVGKIGWFDTTLTTCEDWDFWQRMARSGARFAAVDHLVARYRLRLDSASLDAEQLLVDGMRVITRGHQPDPRVGCPHPSHATGEPSEHVPGHHIRLACWCAGRTIGRNGDAAHLVDLIEGGALAAVDPFDAGSMLVDELLVVSGGVEAAYTSEGRLDPRIGHFLVSVEALLQSPGWARRAQRAIERRVLRRPGHRPLQVGRGLAVRVELTQPVDDIDAPTGAEHLQCEVALEGEPLGVVELPVCDGMVPATVVVDAAAAATYWTVLGRFLERTLYPELLDRHDGGWTLSRGGLVLAADLDVDAQAAMRSAHEVAGWTVLLQELWRRPGWPGQRFYDTSDGDEIAPLQPARGGWCRVEISAPPTDVTARRGEVHAVLEVGGSPVCRSSVPASAGATLVRAGQLRVELLTKAGTELARVAVREGIFGRSLDDGVLLADRLAIAAGAAGRDGRFDRVASQRRPELVLSARRLGDGCGTSASRRAALPAAAADVLVGSAEAAGEPADVVPAGCVAERAAYHPEAVGHAGPPPHGPDGEVSRHRTRIAGLPSLSSIRRLRRRLAPPRPGGADVDSTDRLPILMYHQVSETGPRALDRYRTSPQVLDRQLALLRARGITGVTLDQWQAAISARRPLPGRRICITFDDGYVDFLTHAWPLLRHHGFAATVFIVTDRVGQTGAWDERFGPAAPLLDWDQIGQLESEGVRFGSHTATHTPLTALRPAAAVDELARSRAALHQRLAHPLDALAYPLGDADGITSHLAGGCGYTLGVTCRPTASALTDDPLLLPRFEAPTSPDLTAFNALLDL